MDRVLLLACAQALTATGFTVLVLLGGIVAADIAPRATLATLPVSLAVVAVALTTAPAALLMQRTGRRNGFMLGAALGGAAALLASLAVARASFPLLCAAGMLFGSSMAFSQQYRFAAAECVAEHQAGRAVSWILLGNLGAALIGPPLALLARHWLPAAEYAGSFAVLAALYLLAAALLTRLQLAPPVPASAQAAARPARELVREQPLRVAVLAGVTAFAAMTFVMTAAPISMHVHHHHSVAATSWVIQSHVMAMFLPSLFTGSLVARFGERAMMQWGTVLLAACAGASVLGQSVMHYWLGLVLLGVGWNLLFVSGTTLLARQFRGADRHRAQALNEVTVFGTQACVSLLAGVAAHAMSWQLLNLATLPLLAWMFVVASRTRFAATSITRTRAVPPAS